MLKNVTFYCCYFFMFSFLNAEIYNCKTNHTVHLNIEGIAFYETTNFPKFISFDKFNLCNLTFMFSGEEKYILSVFTRLITYDLDNTNFISAFKSSYSIKNFFDESNFGHPPREGFALQGYVIFESELNKFPLESLTKHKPFKFKNENEYFYVQSHYVYNDYVWLHAFPCFWQFSAPFGYGFKIVVTDMDGITSEMDMPTTLLIKNSTDIILNERNVKLYHPHYNSDSFIELNFRGNNFSNTVGFNAYVTIVKKEYNTTKVICNTYYDNNERAFVWEISEGYKNNIYCIYNLMIPPNSQAEIYSDFFDLEINVDNIYYYLEDNVSTVVTKTEGDISFVIPSLHNKQNRSVFFKFISDGSVSSYGFKLYFKITTCICSQNILPCDGHLYPFTYCGNMYCIFMIHPCPTNISFIQYTVSFDSLQYARENYDQIRIISDNTSIVLSQTYYNRLNFLYYLVLTASENSIEVLTYPSDHIRRIGFNISSFNVLPLDKNIQLLPNFSSYILDTGLYDFVTVEMSQKRNITFELHSDILKLFFWYPDTSLAYGRVCVNDGTHKCEVNQNKFTLYMTSNFPFLVIKIKGEQNNCVFKNNVFNAADTKQFVGIATSDGICEMFIQLASIYYYISDIWTTATTENVKILVGGEPRKLFFEFNNKMAPKWKGIALFSRVYTVRIPKQAAVYIKIKLQNQIFIQQLQFPSLSIYGTPYYGVSKLNYDYYYPYATTVMFDVRNSTMRFTALDYNVPEEDAFYLLVDKQKLYFKEKGSYHDITDQNVTLCYSSRKKSKIDGALIFIETTKDLFNYL